MRIARQTPAAIAAALLAACAAETTARDVVPPEDLAARLPRIERIVPLTDYADELSARIAPEARRSAYHWAADERLPPQRQALVSYRSEAALRGGGRHRPHDGNRDVRQGAFYAERAASPTLCARTPAQGRGRGRGRGSTYPNSSIPRSVARWPRPTARPRSKTPPPGPCPIS